MSQTRYELQTPDLTEILQFDGEMRLWYVFYLAAHYMDPQDLNILSQLADNLLNTGNSAEALKCTETVLKEVGWEMVFSPNFMI